MSPDQSTNSVGIVILTWNGRNDTLACLKSLGESGFPNRQDTVYIVDNGSADGTVAAVRESFPWAVVLQNSQNLGFAGGNNVGIARALNDGHEYVLVLNNDTLVPGGAVEELARHLERFPAVGAVQPVLLRAGHPDRIDSLGIELLRFPGARDRGMGEPQSAAPREPEEIFGPCAAAAMYRRKALEDAGLFDDGFFLLFEDVDLAFRLRLSGWDIHLVPTAHILHKRGVSLHGDHGGLRDYFLRRNTLALALRYWPMGRIVRDAPRMAWNWLRSITFALGAGRVGECHGFLRKAANHRKAARESDHWAEIPGRWMIAPRTPGPRRPGPKEPGNPSGGATVRRNLTALYAGHLAGLLVPLVTIPYLARVLRPDGWGMVAFAQSFGIWVALVAEFGFDLYGTRAVAQSGGDPDTVREAVAGVQSAKLLLCLLLLPLFLVVSQVVPAFREHPEYLTWAAAYAVARAFTPNWYFFGQEKMTWPVALDAGAKILAAAGIFIWVREADDGWVVLALQAVATALAVGTLTLWMHTTVPFRGFGVRKGLRTLRRALGIFVFRSASSLYLEANTFILGLLAPSATVGFFAGAQKVIRAGTGLFQPFSQALFPRLSKMIVEDSKGTDRLLSLSLLLISALGLLIGGVAFFKAELIVRLFLGPGYDGAVPILRVMAFVPPVVGVGTVFGIQWALPKGLERPFTSLVVLAAALNVVLAVLLVPRYLGTGMAVSLLAAELLVAGGLTTLYRKKEGRFFPGLGPPVPGPEGADQ